MTSPFSEKSGFDGFWNNSEYTFTVEPWCKRRHPVEREKERKEKKFLFDPLTKLISR